jgi:hypothetical protein
MAVQMAAISAKDNANEIHPNLRTVHQSAHFPVTLRSSIRELCANSSIVVTTTVHVLTAGQRIAKKRLASEGRSWMAASATGWSEPVSGRELRR